MQGSDGLVSNIWMRLLRSARANTPGSNYKPVPVPPYLMELHVYADHASGVRSLLPDGPRGHDTPGTAKVHGSGTAIGEKIMKMF